VYYDAVIARAVVHALTPSVTELEALDALRSAEAAARHHRVASVHHVPAYLDEDYEQQVEDGDLVENRVGF